MLSSVVIRIAILEQHFPWFFFFLDKLVECPNCDFLTIKDSVFLTSDIGESRERQVQDSRPSIFVEWEKDITDRSANNY